MSTDEIRRICCSASDAGDNRPEAKGAALPPRGKLLEMPARCAACGHWPAPVKYHGYDPIQARAESPLGEYTLYFCRECAGALPRNEG